MKNKVDLVFINPPTITNRSKFYKEDLTFLPNLDQLMAINTGILSMSSFLEAKKYKIKIIDLLEYVTVESAESFLTKTLSNIKSKFFGIACNSGFSYLETIEVAKIIKQLHPQSIIITGGQHIGPLKDIPLKECPEIDINVLYEGEKVLESLLKNENVKHLNGLVYRSGSTIFTNEDYPQFVSLNNFPPLDFSLYPNYSKYSPYIEESRGCYAKCDFCMCSVINKGKIRYKDHKIFEKELEALLTFFPKIELLEVLACTFGVNVKNTISILNAIKKQNIKWTTEFRVDSFWDKDELLEKMVDSGLAILNIGVESLSSEILTKMNKTNNPEFYIERTQKLIQKCREFPQLLLKFNMMMYLDETPDTLSETLKILFEHKEYISEARFSPLFTFPGISLNKKLSEKHVYKNSFSLKRHIFPINLSKYYDAHSAAMLCIELNKIFGVY